MVHPDVRNAIDYNDAAQDRLHGHLDRMRALTVERVSRDRDIAVKVDVHGQLVDLWFKPGLLDRKPAAEIAKEITRLVTTANRDGAAALDEIVTSAYRAPTYTEFLRDRQQPTDAPE